ncbi:MurR/RpiR family transcriptional regulator [Deinococcus peraridilitoris]|uniref:Transcriptional regulator n=1 Tax=Deinococcus peraridilitoris (strain DSM 19664 / LMG 22246 / CIP 109416 / KR-200) TaxID=937777 RepID=L0A4B0_DEIPD|nr:MurR/RpiR family transcriptional regulator [Deinococcus peraridilitoris]AFZ68017.1 transcriptional regulator [Deinococcus peraridilitoris DSM 19664]
MPNTLTDRQSLTALLHAQLPTLSGAQRQLALYLLHHAEQVPFMTTTELARAAGTSQSTVTRFALRLGFESYASLIKVLSAVVLHEIRSSAPAERFQQTAKTTRFSDLLEQERANLQGLIGVLDSADFKRSVQHLARAERIVVAGFAAAASIAEHASLYLARLQANTRCVTCLDAGLLTQLVHWTERDCALLFVAPRPTNDAQLFLQLLRRQGTRVILVADPSSLMAWAPVEERLIVPVTLGPTTAIPAAMLTLASMIVDGVALEHPERTVETLQAFEDVSAAAKLFLKDTTRGEAYWEEQMKTFGNADFPPAGTP